MERAGFGTLFAMGFKKKAEATEEERQESNSRRSEREAAEAKQLSEKAKGKQPRTKAAGGGCMQNESTLLSLCV